MTRITWDDTGERRFSVGVDRGVLYLGDPAMGGAWAGLIGIDEITEEGSTPYFIDGVKYLDVETGGDFKATVRAFTYPSALDAYTGFAYRGSGLYAADQPPSLVNLSWRTLIGNDVDGVDHGYKIHIVWNAMMVPQVATHNTLGADPELVEFSWDLTAVPVSIPGYKPTAHLILDSTQLDPATLALFEDTIYGTELTSAYLPSLEEFATQVGIGFVVDNGDGTWTITAPDENITMNSATQFTIESEVPGFPVYLDNYTFTIPVTPF